MGRGYRKYKVCAEPVQTMDFPQAMEYVEHTYRRISNRLHWERAPVQPDVVLALRGSPNL